jgi:PAS domain S-box-containing protein
MSSLVNSSLLEKILRFSSDMICLLDQQGKFIFVSEACKSILGYEIGEMTGRLFTDFIYPDDIEATRNIIDGNILGAGITDFRNRYRHKSGDVVYLSWSSTYSEDDAALFAIARDVTELHRRSEFLMTMVQNGSEITGVTDETGRYKFVGGPIKKTLGYDPAELLDRDLSHFIHPDDQLQFQKVGSSEAHWSSYTFTYRFKAANGEWRWLETVGNNQVDNPLIKGIVVNTRDITEVRKYVGRLEESEQRFKSLFENSPYLIFFQNRAGRILEINAAGSQLLGCSRDQFLDFHQSRLVDAPEATVYQKVLQEVLETKKPKRLEIEDHYLGENRILDITKIPVIVNKEAIGAYTILQDVTQEKRSIQTVAQQALKLQTIFESITDAFFILDKTWRIVFVNSEWERLIELSRKDVIGRNLWDFFPGQVGKTFYQQYHYALRTGRGVHFEAYLEERDIWLEVKGFPSDEGLSVYFTEISEKIALRQELEKLSKVASNTRYGVVIANDRGDIEWTNNSFSQITGFLPPEIVGKNIVDVLFNPNLTPDLYAAICQALGQSGFYIGEVPFVSKEQMELWLNLEITTVHDEARALKWYILLITDITMNKLVLEERTNFIKELQRHNQSLEQFSHIVSHNLRAPVANILGLTSILELPDKEDPNYFLLQGLKTAAGNLDSIIRDLNQILAIRGNLQQVREQVMVADELQEVLLTFQHEIEKSRITITQDFSQAPVIHTVRGYFKSILFNLFSNAIKYRANDRPAHISVSTVLQQEAIILTVQDNGIGFNVEKEKNKVFGLYKRFHSHIEGKGLGLFLVKTQIEALGGKVKVHSQVGEGSTFKVYFNLNG